ncbi:MAG: hypothetical protein HZC02_03950 [Candidatus Levybacteria bacterium]|nr:hypothetical protein [Candidatus Levybacteria bacterium]
MAFQHHHEKRKIMINLFTIPIFIIILIIATYFNKPIRRIVAIPQRVVQGVHDNRLEDIRKENFSQEIVSDTKDQFSTLKEDVLTITVRDVISIASRSNRIVSDLNFLQREGGRLLDKYTRLDFLK